MKSFEAKQIVVQRLGSLNRDSKEVLDSEVLNPRDRRIKT